MDVVIAYVDGNDPQWQKVYAAVTNQPILKKRFRDWGTLKYLLRGIETYMPFIRNVYLVVSGPTQVPSWASESLRPVFHKDILPPELVPTFNASTIEMGLHRIKGIDEQFLYFNDDMYPVAECSPDDFYVDGKGAMKFSRFVFGNGLYKMLSKNASSMARKYLGLKPSKVYIRPQHICSPMLKSACDELYSKAEKEIISISTPLREDFNVNQYLFRYWQIAQGHFAPVNMHSVRQRFDLDVDDAGDIAKAICERKYKAICINEDENENLDVFENIQKKLVAAFEQILPQKSTFEK